MINVYPITPVPAPRQSRADAFKKGRDMRAEVARYRAFRDEVALRRVQIPALYHHVVFVVACTEGWPAKKKRELEGQPHLFRPDRDNLEKALLDAVFGQDCAIWDGRVTKVWGRHALIIVSDHDIPITPPMHLDAYYKAAGYHI